MSVPESMEPRRHKRRFPTWLVWLLPVFLLLALLPLVSLYWLPKPPPAKPNQSGGHLQIHVLNVGQADAIYLECPGAARHNMLIDSGDVVAMRYPGSPKLFRDEFAGLMGNKKRIDVVISSHPHSDHAGSIAWILDNFEVGTFIDDGMDYGSKTYSDIEERATRLSSAGRLKFLHATTLVNGSHAPAFCPDEGIEAELLRPMGFGGADKNPNNESVVIKVIYASQSFLFTGDAEEEEEQQLLSDSGTRPLLRSTLLKAPHHGSDTSSSAAFLAAVQPQIIVVSAGRKEIGTNKGYRHPRLETIARFLQFTKANGDSDLRALDAFDADAKKWTQVEINAGLYSTSVDGSITLLSDGSKTWKVASDTVKSPVRFVYSRDSNIYHFEDCAEAGKIRPENRMTSDVPPPGKTLHRGCPR